MSGRTVGCLSILAAAFFGYLLVSGFKTGRMDLPTHVGSLSVRRDKKPICFWMFAAGNLLLFLATLWVAINLIL